MDVQYFRNSYLGHFRYCLNGLLFCLIFPAATVTAQMKSGQKEAVAYYTWFDQQVQQEHLPLFNGIGYVEKYKVVNEYHKFYKSIDFLKGSLYYDGQLYPNLEIKYDLHEDVVLLNLKNGQRVVLLQPDQEKIEGFEIDGQFFVHIKDSISKVRKTFGYYELLYEGDNFQLLEKHTKKRFERKGKNSLYSEFKGRNKNYLYYKGEHYTLNNRKDFEDVFPELKRDIQTYSKKRFPRQKKQAHLIALSRRIDDLINKPKAQP